MKDVTPNGTGHLYVERRAGVAGGKVVISGTRVKVTQVAFETERLGWTADEIIEAHPHLTLPQIHDALSFYYENQAELDAEMIAEVQLSQGLAQAYNH